MVNPFKKITLTIIINSVIGVLCAWYLYWFIRSLGESTGFIHHLIGWICNIAVLAVFILYYLKKFTKFLIYPAISAMAIFLAFSFYSFGNFSFYHLLNHTMDLICSIFLIYVSTPPIQDFLVLRDDIQKLRHLIKSSIYAIIIFIGAPLTYGLLIM